MINFHRCEESQPCAHCGASRGVRCYVKGATVPSFAIFHGKRVRVYGSRLQPEPVSARPHAVREKSMHAAAKYIN